MKTITLRVRWIDQVDPVTREEYPAGWSGLVTDDRAARAAAAGVLDDADYFLGLDLASKDDTVGVAVVRIPKPSTKAPN